tara:strand:- start:6282 stop:8279 length:1998 start_codon:yes stop_codon:yes gene_type:complete
MSQHRFKLPKNKKQICQLIRSHAEKEISRLSYRRITWLLTYYYLNGMRRFDVFDPESGNLSPHYLDEEGNLEFQSQEMLSAIDRASARLSSMDLRPKVMRTGTSLPMIRQRATAQLLADSLVSDDQIAEVSTKFAHLFTALGSCGIQGHILDHPTIGLTGDLEVIHPKELFPFPSLGQDYTKQAGMMRQRIVPLETLTDKFGSRIKSNLEDMEYYEVQVGDPLEELNESLVEGHTVNPFNGKGYNSQSVDAMTVVRIRELWMEGARGTCSRYIICSGDYMIEDEDLSSAQTYCPIGFARFIENGSFHGAGLFDLLFSINREMEKMLKALFNNIREMDRYGVVVMPQGSFNERSVMREVGNGLRMISYQPDPLNEKFAPFTIAPHNAGDIPGKTAAFAKSLMQGINPVQDLIQEKGRIDSATGLQFLDEQINRAMTNPTMGVVQAFGKMYRSMVSNASRELILKPRPIPVQAFDLNLAGAVIDYDKSEISFQNNPIPNVAHLTFAVRQINPRSEVVRKQEAMQMFQAGLMDPDGFKLFALKEGLDFAMWIDEDQSAYEQVVQNILNLYGNGTDPGQVIITPHTSRPELQMRVLSSFMSGPLMSKADPLVIDEFKKYREAMIQFMGASLPAMVPNPDSAALFAEQRPQSPPTGPQPGPGMSQGAING